MDRSKKIIRSSLVGVGVNLVLVLFKAAVGLATNSIAVILDAVNNFSDALSSVITIVGTKLSGKAPDKKHPYGYGRIEYLTSVIIAVIVLLAGVTSLRESIDKTIHPQDAEYSAVTLVIIAVAVLVKFFCGRYVKGVGKKINSGSLIASGSDAFFDAILSFATLIAGILNLLWGWRLEGPLGIVISLIIVKAGIEMLLETLNSIIGVRADKELTDALKETINSYPEVQGAYDLTLHNYGPTRIIGSVHVQLPDNMTAKQIHALTRRITYDVYLKHGIILTVGIYASDDSSPELTAVRQTLTEAVAARPEILQMHGFYGDAEQKTVSFDLIVDFKADAEKVRGEICREMTERYPEYRFDIILDSDYSD